MHPESDLQKQEHVSWAVRQWKIVLGDGVEIESRMLSLRGGAGTFRIFVRYASLACSFGIRNLYFISVIFNGIWGKFKPSDQHLGLS